MNQSGRPITCTAVDTCVINQSSQFNATSWLLEYPALLCFDDAGSVNLQTRMVEARDAERWGGRAKGRGHVGPRTRSFKSLYHAQNNFGWLFHHHRFHRRLDVRVFVLPYRYSSGRDLPAGRYTFEKQSRGNTQANWRNETSEWIYICISFCWPATNSLCKSVYEQTVGRYL